MFGSLVISWLQGSLTWSSFWGSVMGATRTTVMIMLILAGAAFMSAAMAYTRIPSAIAEGVGNLSLSPYMLLAALTLFYVVLGMFLDGILMIT
jgi:TRAP-type C4-dicarboxylate transport system permease large subunit